MGTLSRRFPIYSRLLNLYPPAYRNTYRQQMLQTLADMLDDTPRSKHAAIWIRTTQDFALTAAQQQIVYLGGIMVHDMPAFIKRNTIIGLALLIPFGAAVAANAADQLLNHQTLYGSWAWHMPFIGLWVLWLPLAAFCLALGSLMAFGIQRSRDAHENLWAILRRPEYYWPLLIVLLGGGFILTVLFTHDSVHCVTGNPIREVRNWNQTWQCIQQGASTYPFQHPLAFLKRAFGL